MNRTKSILDMVHKGRERGLVHLNSQGQTYIGRTICLHGQQAINFSSCSYLGLSNDIRLTEAALSAMNHYGHSFPTSRSYVSLGILDELEQQLEQLFGYPVLLSTTTSLGHLAYLPTLVSKGDAVILDHQVHNSVATAAEILKARGSHLEVVRHSRLDLLEERIHALQASHEKIWYLGDGIYSMYGDRAPVAALNRLLDKYPQLHVYLDDAHGMSWTGPRGRGYVLAEEGLHPRMALITSLGKAFGVLGGAMVFPNQALKDQVKHLGGPLIFSSPMTPGNIGAAQAAAEIHCSPEINFLQDKLRERNDFFRNRALELGIPMIGQGDTPIFFVPVGKPEAAFEIGERMLKRGFYQSFSVFPSVPLNNAGLRYTLTNWLDLEDIDHMLTVLAEERRKVLSEMDLNEKILQRYFKGMEWRSAGQ